MRVAVAICLVLFASITFAVARDAKALPAWLNALIARHVGADSGFLIQECTYRKNRCFVVSAGEVLYLLNDDGTQRCQFGGYSGHVEGSCEPRRIKYVRELYPKEQEYDSHYEPPVVPLY